uniref:Transposase n=1 Tax=Meloidogyne hapla TaxID=6305 RepID=A0A1I8C2B7_MELHA
MPDYTWLIDWRLRAKRPLGYREWRRRVRYVDSRDEILNVFRQTVEWIISERMENECRIECVNEHEIQRMETGNVQGRTVTTNTRPMTAQPRIPLRELSVFALTSPPLPGEETV